MSKRLGCARILALQYLPFDLPALDLNFFSIGFKLYNAYNLMMWHLGVISSHVFKSIDH